MSSTSGPTFNPFCKTNWKTGALILIILVSMTAMGGFYLLDLYDDDFYDHGYTLPWWDASGMSSPALQEKVSHAVVSIESGGDYASGVLLHPQGYVITVLHSIKDKKSINVTVHHNNQTTIYKGEILKQLPDHDIALIKLVSNQRFPYILLAKSLPMSFADVYALGYTESGQFIMQAGQAQPNELSIQINNNRLNNLMQTDAVYTWEQNGGPVVNHNGELVGVNLAIKDNNNQIHGLMIPAKILMAHLQDVVPLNKVVSNKQSMPAAPPQAEPQTLAVAWWNQARDQFNKANNIPATGPVMSQVAFVDPQHSPDRPLTLLDVGNQHPLKLGAYEMNDLIAMLLVGIIAGIMGTVTPLLGALFMMIAMYDVMNYDFYIARPVIFLTMAFVYAVITIRFRMNKTADRLFSEHSVILQLPWIILGVFLGFVTGNVLTDNIVVVLLALFVVLVMANIYHDAFIEKAFVNFVHNSGIHHPDHHPEISDHHLESNDPYQLLTRNEKVMRRHKETWLARAVGAFPVSFSSGLFGNYVGAIVMQSSIHDLSEEKSRALSAQLIFFASLTGAVIALIHGMENNLFKPETPMLLSMILIPAVFGGAFVANHILKYISKAVLYQAVLLILFVFTIFMVIA